MTESVFEATEVPEAESVFSYEEIVPITAASIERKLANLGIAGAVSQDVSPDVAEVPLRQKLIYAPDPDLQVDLMTGSAYQRYIGARLRRDAEVAASEPERLAATVEDLKGVPLEAASPMGAYAVSQRELALLEEFDGDGDGALGPIGKAALVTGYLEEQMMLEAQEGDFAGLGAKIASGAALFIPGRTLGAVATLDDKQDENQGLVDIPSFKGARLYQQLFDEWWSSTPEQRAARADEILEFARKGSGNNYFVYVALLQPFIQQSEIEDLRFNMAIDVIDLSGIALLKMSRILKAAEQARQANISLKNIKKAKAVPYMGYTVAKALGSPTIAKSLKITQQQLAEEAMPALTSSVLPSKVGGAEAEVLKVFEDQLTLRAKEVRTLLDDAEIPQRSFVDEHEARKLQTEVLGNIQSAVAKNAKIVEQTPTGFVVEFEAPVKTVSGLRLLPLRRKIRELQKQWDNVLDNIENFPKAGSLVRGGNATAGKKIPPIPKDHVRYYHGGNPEGVDGPLWFTSHLPDARGWAERGPEMRIWYVDVPKTSPFRGIAEPENGIPYSTRIEFPSEIANKRKLFAEATENANTAVVARQKAIGVLDKAKRDLEKQISVLQKDRKLLETRSTRQVQVNYTRDQAGALEGALIKGGVIHLSSNEVLLKNILRDATGSASAIDFNIEKARVALASAWKEANRGVSGKRLPGVQSRADVLDAVEIAGDELKKVFTPEQLLAGFTHKGQRLQLKTGAEIQAYYLRRSIWDDLHQLKNEQVRRDLIFNQFKAVYLKNFSKSTRTRVEFARPTKSNKIPSGVTRVWDAKMNKLVDVNDALRTRLKGGKEMVVQFRTPVEKGEEVFSYAVVDARRGLRELPKRVLNYAEGYIPRIHKGIFYSVERLGPKLVDGQKVGNYRELARYFDNVAEAEDWAAAQKALGKGEFEVRSSRDIALSTPGLADEVDIKGYGGLFSDARTEGIIFKGWNNNPPDRLTATEALEAYVNHISVRFPINEFRLNLIAKYLNTYGEYLSNPKDWLSEINPKAKGVTTELKKSLEGVRNIFQDLLHIPTAQERAWQQFSFKIGDALSRAMGKKGEKLYTGFYKMGNIDPVAEARAAAFHTYLGWFNIRQLFVQAMGAAVVIGAHPVAGVKAMHKYMALRATMYSRNEKYIRAVGHTVAKLGFMSTDEFVQLHKEFRMTGLSDSVRSTADYGASSAGLPVAGGAWRATLSAGLVPFREGELVVRGAAWLVARELYLKKNKLKHLDIDNGNMKQVDDVTRDSLHLALNLNRANRARWQQGLLSLPTQFWQVMAKFAEAMLPMAFGGTGQFTTAQKVRVLTIGTAIPFGLSGIPWGEWLFGKIASEAQDPNDPGSPFFDSVPEFLKQQGMTDADMLRLVRGGAVEYVLNSLTGADVDISSRASIPAGVEELVQMWLDGDRSIAIIAAGAFGQIPQRAFQQAGLALELFGDAAKHREIAPTKVKQAILEVAKITSSWNNASRANWWWKAEMFEIQRKDGSKIPIRALDREEDYGTVLAAAMGFQPHTIADTMSLQRYKRKAREELVTERVNALVRQFTEHYPVDGALTQDDLDYAATTMEMIYLDIDDPEIRNDIQKQVADKLLAEPKTLSLITETYNLLYENEGKLAVGGPVDNASIATNPLLLPENIE